MIYAAQHDCTYDTYYESMTQDYYRTGVLPHELMRGKLNRPKSMYIKTMNTNAAENGNRQLANFKGCAWAIESPPDLAGGPLGGRNGTREGGVVR